MHIYGAGADQAVEAGQILHVQAARARAKFAGEVHACCLDFVVMPGFLVMHPA